MIMDILRFFEDSLTASIPSVCGVLVYKDRMPRDTKYQLSVMFMKFSIF